MGNWGIKVTKDGKGVSSTTPEDYIFNSLYGSVKTAQEPPNKEYQTVDVPAGGSATVTITHNLGFPPLVLLFSELNPGSGRWYMGSYPMPSPLDSSSGILLDGSAISLTYVDDTYLKITYCNSSGSQKTVKYYYFIFGDNG
jgi:hypothetical protein